MPKLSNYNISDDEKKVDEELVERVKRMLDDSFFEFALGKLEIIYDFIQKTGNIKEWMTFELNTLENFKEREERE